jgi:hypothetical protein
MCSSAGPDRVDRPRQAVEIIPGRYYVTAIKNADSVTRSPIVAANLAYCIDASLVRVRPRAARARARPRAAALEGS